MALREVLRERDELRRSLSAADYRYLEFQLWQEGTARFIEYAVARAAAAASEPSSAFQALDGFETYGIAAIALLLDITRPDWKRSYVGQPFELATLLQPSP